MKPVFLCEFSCESDVFVAFRTQPDGCRVLFAWYGYGDYCGAAFVLYEKAGCLYEVNGSHCSCYGLEGQWESEPTSVEALRYRMKKGYLGHQGHCEDGNFADQLEELLVQYESMKASSN